MDGHFYKILKDHEGKSFRLNARFANPLSLDLSLLRESEAWTASVGPTEIQEQAERSKMKSTEYYVKLKHYFIDTGTGTEFRFVDNVFIVDLLLKNNMKIKFFSMSLEKACFNTCALNLLDKVHLEYLDVTRRLIKLTDEKNQLENSSNDYEQKLSELVERKQADEQDLYGSFVMLLNEKKRRIQHLNELLLAFKRGRPVLNPPVLKAKSNTTRKKKYIKKDPEDMVIKKRPKSESEHESDRSYNTDEDCEDKPSKKLKIHDDNINFDSKPSTSKGFDFLRDSSPPCYDLPKRIKADTIMNVRNHTTDKVLSLKEPEIMVIDDNCSNRPTNTTATYNTQDLLDTLS